MTDWICEKCKNGIHCRKMDLIMPPDGCIYWREPDWKKVPSPEEAKRNLIDPTKMTIDEAYEFAKAELSSALGQLIKKGVVITDIRYRLSDCQGNTIEYLVDVKVRDATFMIPVKVGAAGE